MSDTRITREEIKGIAEKADAEDINEACDCGCDDCDEEGGCSCDGCNCH